jgi:predicted Zn-dependent protease
VNLEKAEAMSKRTVDRNPSSPVYLDTYGWVLFRMENYSEAVIYLQRAVDSDSGKSGEIIEHLADAMSMNGQETEALIMWNLALEKGDASDKIEEKIKFKKYIP